MAINNFTLANLIKFNDVNTVDNGTSDLVLDAPVLAKLNAVKSNSTNYTYTKEITAPVIGFRAPYVGLDNNVGIYDNVTVPLKYLDASFSVDVAVADGARNGKTTLIDRLAQGELKAALAKFENQMFEGADADGFAGFNQAISAKSNSQFIDATGSTANGTTSVYFIYSPSDETGVNAVLGQDGLIDVGETYETLDRDSNGKPYNVYRTKIAAWTGVTLGSLNSIVRIGNLTAQSTKGLTDALMAKAYARMKGKVSYIAMNWEAAAQLQASRVATNPTGAPVDMPEVYGTKKIPIIVTDNISSTQAVVA